MRIDNAFVRALIGCCVFAALLGLFLLSMNAAMAAREPGAKAAYLFFAGPVGAMTTHLHTPLFAVLVLLLLPLVIAAAVSRRRRILFLGLCVAAWFALGAMFATIPLS